MIPFVPQKQSHLYTLESKPNRMLTGCRRISTRQSSIRLTDTNSLEEHFR